MSIFFTLFTLFIFIKNITDCFYNTYKYGLIIDK